MDSTRLFSRVVHLFVCLTLVMPGPLAFGQTVDMEESVRQFEVVPCLLPARIRKLGNMTYPERRRLVEVSARDCELRGGEYTFYDRAAPESAAAFFRKLADDGVVDAQVSLGDVYQYLFEEPDYEQAVKWYRTAMENGSARGKMKLARLYERGLGVPKDGLMATNLWREATGAGEELVLASELEAAQTRADERIAELTEALRERSEEAEQVRAELARSRQEIQERQAAIAAAEAELAQSRELLAQRQAAAPDAQEIAGLKEQIAQKQRRIEDQRFQIDTLEADLGVREAQLNASLRQAQLQNERLSQELARVSARSDAELQAALAEAEVMEQRVAKLNDQLAETRAELDRSRSEHDTLLAQLEQARNAADDTRVDSRERIAELETARAQQASRLDAKQQELEALRDQLATASAASQDLKSRLDQQVHETEAARARFAQTEAELQSTKEELSSLRSELDSATTELARLDEERKSLRQQLAAGEGRASNADELRQLLAVQDDRVQRQQARIGELQAQVEKYRGELTEISLRRASYAKRTPITDTSNIRLPSDVKLGKYYSLIIGNSEYEHLNDLDNASNDARGIDRVLREEYGFDSTLLVDATEKEIFRAFQELAGKVSEDDMVLIYYAGHGYEIHNESYWLPVEVQSRQEAEVSGISSLKVADWVRAMPAKHVMLIADSCYSGSGIETTGGFTYSLQDLEEMLPYFMKSRSRTMLTSGGVSPVMDGDGGGGEFSIFTRELIGLLKENRGVLYGEALYDHLVERVKYTPDGVAVNQTPMFGSIESAGHECGQFVLVRPRLRT